VSGGGPWISASGGVILELFVDRKLDIGRRSRWNRVAGQGRAFASYGAERTNEDPGKQHPGNAIHRHNQSNPAHIVQLTPVPLWRHGARLRLSRFGLTSTLECK